MNTYRRGLKLKTSEHFFLLNTAYILRLMYKKSNSFVYIFVVNCQFFPNNTVTVCPIKLKIDMLHHLSDALRNTVFSISAIVPLIINNFSQYQYQKELVNIFRFFSWK